MKFLLAIVTFLIIIQQTSAFLEITEINYNPEGSDNNQEYIELHTDLNLSGLTIKDQSSEDSLIQLKHYPSNYSLIVEEGFDYTNINATIYSVGATIGNNLNNDEDLIIILNGTEVLDAIHYYEEWGANNNQKSLCKIDKFWQECNPTPGGPNKAEEITQEYTIEITEFLPNPKGDDDAPMPEGEWIEIFNHGDKEIDLTGVKIVDKTNHILIISNTNTQNTIIEPEEYKLIYTNGMFGFLNNEGLEEIRLLTPGEMEIEKITYTDSRESSSWSKINNTWRLTKPTPEKENPELKNTEEGKESEIEIKEVYLGSDNSAKFGDNIRIKLEIYKGDETKESVKAYIEKGDKKISKTTSFNILEKYSENTITIPIQISPNCNLKELEGEYTIKVEGLGTRTDKEITIKGINKDLCEKEIVKEENVITKTKDQEFETVINNQVQSNEIIYESKAKKAVRNGIYFFSLILVLLIVNLTIEKWKK